MSTVCLYTALELTEHFPRAIASLQHTCGVSEIAPSLYRAPEPDCQRGRTVVQGGLLDGEVGDETPSDQRVNLGVSGGYFPVLSAHHPSSLH